MEAYQHQAKKKQISYLATGKFAFQNNYANYGINCFMLDFTAFFRSLKRLVNELLEQLLLSLPEISKPRQLYQDGSRSLVFIFPKISVLPILEGSFSADFENSMSIGVLEPPPINTMPAGNSPDLFIFFKWFSISSKISDKRASII